MGQLVAKEDQPNKASLSKLFLCFIIVSEEQSNSSNADAKVIKLLGINFYSIGECIRFTTVLLRNEI